MALFETKVSERNNWAMLILVASTTAFAVALPQASLPVLFREISRDLNLNLVQIGSVWGVLSLGSIFTVPIGGILCDRFGIKRTVSLICLFSGLSGALRGFSNGFVALMATTFLCGLVINTIFPALSISVSLSSSKQRQGIGQACIAVGAGIGYFLGSITSAAFISPLVGGWRNTFFVFGGLTILTGLVWLLKVKEPARPNQSKPVNNVQFKQLFRSIAHIKPFWLLSLSLLFHQGSVFGLQGFLPLFLQENGWSVISASSTIAVFFATATVCAIPLTLISDRLRSRKSCLLISFLATAGAIGLISSIQGWAIWVCVILAGIFSQMHSALTSALCIEITQKETPYWGAALGLTLSFGLIGRAFSPPIGNSMSNLGIGTVWPFVFWSALAVIGAIILLMVKEPRPVGYEDKVPTINN